MARDWTNTTPEQRKEALEPVTKAHILKARERRIAELIAKAPPLTPEQRARLAVLLNANPGQVAS
jgi:hypothetical protein